MRVKMAVWEPGKADPSRFDRASSIDEFVMILRSLNPGDEVGIFFIEDGTNKHDIITLPVNREVLDVPEVVSTAVWGAELNVRLPLPTVPAEFVPCLNMTVATSVPDIYQDLYTKVTDIIAVEGWLTPDQHKVIDEEVLKVVEKHNRE